MLLSTASIAETAAPTRGTGHPTHRAAALIGVDLRPMNQTGGVRGGVMLVVVVGNRELTVSVPRPTPALHSAAQQHHPAKLTWPLNTALTPALINNDSKPSRAGSPLPWCSGDGWMWVCVGRGGGGAAEI